MLNPVEAYAEAGRKAAQARNERDERRAAGWADWFHTARRLEAVEDREAVEQAYRDAYSKTRRI
jgi:hypothetical protein